MEFVACLSIIIFFFICIEMPFLLPWIMVACVLGVVYCIYKIWRLR